MGILESFDADVGRNIGILVRTEVESRSAYLLLIEIDMLFLRL